MLSARYDRRRRDVVAHGLQLIDEGRRHLIDIARLAIVMAAGDVHRHDAVAHGSLSVLGCREAVG